MAEAATLPKLLYSQDEACAMLGVCIKILRREIEAGRLRYVIIGKAKKFSQADLEAYVENARKSWVDPAKKSGTSPPRGRGRRTDTATSLSTVVDFEEALKRTTAKKQNAGLSTSANRP